MAKFSDLYIGYLISIIIITLIIIFYYYHNDRISGFSSELQEKKTLHYRNLLNSASSGFIRGFLMGFILGDYETAIITGISVSCVNPIMLTYENSF